ncbi:MAG: porin [Gemmatimonadaceae bacterium]|jgi:hypothetical protein|nr:porin [Gemmatimonadaceae bacterium]
MTAFRILRSVFAAGALPSVILSQPAARDSTPVVTLGLFVDGYVAWDRNRPVPRDRAFTTQPARHNEFNINLAHLSLGVEQSRVRARFTAQAGTSVQANYASEPADGVISGPSVSQHIQEAYVGVQPARNWWIDGGIYLSPIGFESWISLDNPTYTRSLTADYTPYYLSGVRATWQASPRVVATLQAVNGWQIISERNDGKALVARVDWTASDAVALGASAFVGEEQPQGDGARARQFGQLLARLTPRSGTEAWLTVDGGLEDGRDGPTRRWWSLTAIGRQRLTDAVSLSLRGERYGDPRGVLIPVGDGRGGPMFTGGSMGFDVRIAGGALWRTEARYLQADQRVFPSGAGARPTRDNVVVTTSLAFRADHRVR